MIGTHTGQVYEDEMHAHLDIPAMPNLGSDNEDENLSSRGNEPKKIYFVRHGDTNLNAESAESSSDQPVRGWSNIPLNSDGIAQAKKAAESVKDLPISHIVSSDLPRAKQTANIIGQRLGITPEFHPGLRTWNLGEFTGKSGKDVHDEVNRLCSTDQDERPKGGESFNEFKDRILSSMSDIVQKHNENEVLVVSHNSPERIINSWIEAGQPQKQEGIGDLVRRLFPATPKGSRDPGLDPERRTNLPGMGFNIPYQLSATIENADISPENRAKLYEQFARDRQWPGTGKALSLGSEHTSEFNKTIEAIKQSPVAHLGFDPAHTYLSRDVGETSIGGSQDKNAIWVNANYPTTLMHESMHAGLDKLVQAGKIPPMDRHTEEMTVRRMMHKHFGPVEAAHGPISKMQMDEALATTSMTEIEKIEKAAEKHFKELHPGLANAK